MLIAKISPLTGKLNEMELPITEKQFADWKSGTLIQDAMPQLTADEREFLMTGYTKEDWDSLFPPDEPKLFLG